MKKAIASVMIVGIMALFGATSASAAEINNVTSTGEVVRAVNWSIDSYPSNVGINITLLRKISDSEYELVRMLSYNHRNDEGLIWVPTLSEILDPNLYVEVTCNTDYQLPEGCHVSGAPVKAF